MPKNLTDDDVLARATPETISAALKAIPDERIARAVSGPDDSRSHAHKVRALVVEYLRKSRFLASVRRS